MDALILIFGDFMGGFKFKKFDIITNLETCQLESAAFRGRFGLLEKQESVEIMKSLGIELFYDVEDLIAFKSLLFESMNSNQREDCMDDDFDE